MTDKGKFREGVAEQAATGVGRTVAAVALEAASFFTRQHRRCWRLSGSDRCASRCAALPNPAPVGRVPDSDDGRPLRVCCCPSPSLCQTTTLAQPGGSTTTGSDGPGAREQDHTLGTARICLSSAVSVTTIVGTGWHDAGLDRAERVAPGRWPLRAFSPCRASFSLAGL